MATATKTASPLELFEQLDDDRKAFKRSLDAGADPNTQHPGAYGNDPWRGAHLLECAIKNNDLASVKALLAAGADLTRKARDGHTFMEIAEHQASILQALKRAAGSTTEAPSVKEWLERLIEKTSSTVAYGRFRSKKLRQDIEKEIGRRGPELASNLAQQLSSESADWQLRSAAAEVLAVFGRESVPMLTDALQRSRKADDVTLEVLTRRSIVHALADLKHDASGAENALRDYLTVAKGPDKAVVEYALAQITV